MKGDINIDKKIIIHADDFGINKEITDKIIDSIYNGSVSSTSIVCNTIGFEYAIEKFKYRYSEFEMRLHLNLVEGTPLMSEGEVYLLLNSNGEFKYNFISLWIKYLLSFRKTRKKLRNQIKIEILAQICKFRTALESNNSVKIDSHTHIHMLPFIMNIIIELAETEPITYIRVPYEKFYFSRKDWQNYFTSNIIKHLILNLLSLIQIKKIKNHNIKTNGYFIGVLATGKMTFSSVKSACNKIKGNSTIEILFHPGGVENINIVSWTRNASFKKYYTSPNRKFEADTLKSVEFNNFINYENISNN